MTGIHEMSRLLKILRVARRHALGSLIEGRSIWFLAGSKQAQARPRGERLRQTLEELGPIFIKLGQALSTRRDLLPQDIADELVKLQDQVPPFSSDLAVATIERAYGRKLSDVFAEFDSTPLASASVAQVHAARLHPVEGSTQGQAVVVKVLRPDIRRTIRQDLKLMALVARFIERWVPEGERLKPTQVVAEYAKVIHDELDLLREAANASQLRANWLGSELIYHPVVFFELTQPNVLVMERVHGVAVDDVSELRAQGVDFQVLAERGVEIFFKQVFRDNFFHADMHPGNIFVDTTQPKQPKYVALDFGIVGSLTPNDQRYLAENFLAFFRRDYRRVAELHLESGWVPSDTRVDEFESAIRTVCEPIFQRPLSEISFGFFLMRLFQTARRFRIEVQPQLVLLQKTMLNIEGLGRQLYPQLDLWKTAQPIMEAWMRERLSPRRTTERLKVRLPAMLDRLPDLLQGVQRHLEHDGISDQRALQQAIVEMRDELARGQRRARLAILASAFLLGAPLLPGYMMVPPWWGWVSGAVGVMLGICALRPGR